MLNRASPESRPVSVGILGAPEDGIFVDECAAHLTQLHRMGDILMRTSSNIAPGDVVAEALARDIATSDIVIVLLSVDLLRDAQYYELLIQLAAAHRWTVPVLLRDVSLSDNVLAALPMLPRNRKPVVRWRPRDRAWLEVTTTVEELVNNGGRTWGPPETHNITIHRLLEEVRATTPAPALQVPAIQTNFEWPWRNRSSLVLRLTFLVGAAFAAAFWTDILDINDIGAAIWGTVIVWALYKCSVIIRSPTANKKSICALGIMLLTLLLLMLLSRREVPDGTAQLLFLVFVLLTAIPVAAMVLAILGLLEIRASKASAAPGARPVYTQGFWQATGALVLALALIVGVAFNAARPNERRSASVAPDWTPFTSPEQGFEILFPSVPAKQIVPQQLPDTVSFIHAYVASYRGDLYIVRSEEVHPVEVTSAEQTLDGWEALMRGQDGVQVLDRADLLSNSAPARELTTFLADGELTVRSRMIATGHRIFIVMVVSPKAASADAVRYEVANRFFSSFTLRTKAGPP